MTTTRSLMAAALALALLIAPLTFAKERKGDPQPVKVLQSWNGKPKNNALRKLEPVNNIVADQNTWSQLWKAWRPNEEVAAVDFKTQIVLVFTAEGPNSVGCTPTHDGKGNVQALAMSTMMAGPGFGYLMLSINREGVKTVNGKPLPGEKAVEPAAPPANAVEGAPGSSPPGPAKINLTATTVVAAAEPPAIKEFDKIKPRPDVVTGMKPLVLKSEKEAAEHFEKEELAKLTQQVDFTKQFVLVFAWSGSGGDRLDFTVAESYPEQIFFTYKRGFTKDLRHHLHIYALRANVKWSVK